uniref:Isopenicillin N synthase-like Fe(2+) 2OG dioxygenase domain-containing protein n=1 Tax=Fagus sylvatica TaxID=28930 RepID=A0A2N9G601_FAGSY
MATAAASVLFQIGTGQNVMKPRVRHTPNLKTTTIIKSSAESYDRANDVKRFDDSKVGVRGLVDSGITTIPRFFVHPLETLSDLKPDTRTGSGPEIIPAINLSGVGLWNEVTWDQEIKRLEGLLCEGLGVETGRLKDMTCLEGRVMVGHYYPYCPQPDLTVGLAYHTDPGVLTVVQQDHVEREREEYQWWLPAEKVGGGATEGQGQQATGKLDLRIEMRGGWKGTVLSGGWVPERYCTRWSPAATPQLFGDRQTGVIPHRLTPATAAALTSRLLLSAKPSPHLVTPAAGAGQWTSTQKFQICIDNEAIMQRYQTMKTRRRIL